MGCRESLKKSARVDLETLLTTTNNSAFPEKLRAFLESTGTSVDSYIEINSLAMPALAYTLLNYKPEKFRILHSDFGASFSVMEEYFSSQGTSGMRVLCERGYTAILKQYLPHYLPTALPSASPEFTMDFSQSTLQKPRAQLSHVQLACYKKQYGVLETIQSHYRGTATPEQFDLNYQHPCTYECCALIAVKEADLVLLKYLRSWGAQFNVVDQAGRGPVQVAALWSKKRPEVNYSPVFQYLSQTLKLEFPEDFSLLQDKPHSQKD